MCLALFQKCEKCLVFPVFWAFLGWLIIVHLGLEGLGVLCFLCLFFFVVLLLFLFCLLCYWFCFLFCFLFFFSYFIFFCSLFVLFFVFFGGLKGQVRWPKGPPHLALNPPYFLVLFIVLLFFCLFFFGFCFFLFLFFWRV